MKQETKFTLSIELGNDAMSGPCDVAEALESVASKLRAGQESGRIRDTNGNTVGEFEFSSDTE